MFRRTRSSPHFRCRDHSIWQTRRCHWRSWRDGATFRGERRETLRVVGKANAFIAFASRHDAIVEGDVRCAAA
jgi:hypothetical protein